MRWNREIVLTNQGPDSGCRQNTLNLPRRVVVTKRGPRCQGKLVRGRHVHALPCSPRPLQPSSVAYGSSIGLRKCRWLSACRAVKSVHVLFRCDRRFGHGPMVASGAVCRCFGILGCPNLSSGPPTLQRGIETQEGNGSSRAGRTSSRSIGRGMRRGCRTSPACQAISVPGALSIPVKRGCSARGRKGVPAGGRLRREVEVVDAPQ